MRYECEIRGMFACPPAKLLIKFAPGGAPLTLEREPGNEYDVNAIKVWIEPTAFSEEDLEEGSEFESELAGYGRTLEEFAETPAFRLGYVGKEWAAAIAPLMDGVAEPKASFYVRGDGKPGVIVEITEGT